MDLLNKYELLHKMVDNDISEDELIILNNELETDNEFASNAKEYIDNVIAYRTYEKIELSKKNKKKRKIYSLIGYAASFLLLIGILYFISENVNKNTEITKLKAKQDSINLSLKLKNDSLLNMIAEYKKNKTNTNNDTVNNDTVNINIIKLKRNTNELKVKINEPKNNDKKILAFININRANFIKGSSRGKDSTKIYFKRKKYNEGIRFEELGLKDRYESKCKINFRVGVMALNIAQENSKNDTILQKAIDNLNYSSNKENCEANINASLLYLSYCYILQKDNKKAYDLLNKLIEHSEDSNDEYVKKAKELIKLIGVQP